MKSMLYVGATLMIGASIYGFVDYRQTHSKKEFREMYVEKKATAPVSAVSNVESVAEPVKKLAVNSKAVAKKKKGVAITEEIVIVEPIAETDKMVPEKTSLKEEPVATVAPAKESSALKTVNKKKKVRKEYFSRGRMPEDEVLIEKPAKKDPDSNREKKTESKEL